MFHPSSIGKIGAVQKQTPLMETMEPTYRIELNGKDATKDLSPYVLSVSYTDNLDKKADELRVELDNSDFRFLNDWFMSTGMTVKAWIGNMYCGTFMIDENSEKGVPHGVEFRAQSAEFHGPIRTRKSFAHYKKSLRDIVQKYANDHKLKVIGTIPDLNLENVIQFRESDIDFLHRIAHLYGCICSVKGGNLVFDSIENIWKREAAKTIRLKDMISYHFSTSLADTTDSVVSAYDDIYNGKIQGAITMSDDIADKSMEIKDNSYGKSNAYKNLVLRTYKDNITQHSLQTTPGFADEMEKDYNGISGIVTIIHKKAESTEEAQRLTTGALLQNRKKKHICTITLPLDELLVAGNSVNILEVGKRSGYWLIESSTHKIVKKGGATTTIKGSHGAQTTGQRIPEDKGVGTEINQKTAGVPAIPDSFIQSDRF